MSSKKNQSGNVLFLILIAVALFAALSYAVTQSSRGGGNADSETLAINSATVAQYISSIQQALMRMTIINGCTEDEISFASDNWGHTEYSHTPASRTKCQIFHRDGGGVSFQRIDPSLLDTAHSALPRYGDYMYGGNLNIVGKGAFTGELTMIVPFLDQDVCEKLHTEFGESGGAARYTSNWSTTNASSLFNGDYTSGHVFGNAAWGDAHCMDTGSGAGGHCMFYVILIVR